MTEITKEQVDECRALCIPPSERGENVIVDPSFVLRLLDNADELRRLREGVWVRAVGYYHDTKPGSVEYFDGEYWQTPTVEVFDHDPGGYTHSGGSPDQYRLKLPIEVKGETP